MNGTPATFYRRYDLPACRRTSERVRPAQHQSAALTKLDEWFASKASPAGTLLVLPTGAGKTFTATHFLCSQPLSQGYKVLWLAHTHHLLEQAFFAFEKTAAQILEPKMTLAVRVVSGTVGHFKLAEVEPEDDVLSATVQTVWNGASRDHRSLARFVDAANGKLFIVVDEAHHTPAPTYRNLVGWLRERAEVRLLGLTATPTYTDDAKRGWLARMYPQGIAHQADVDKLILAGVLARPKLKEPIRTNFDPGLDEGEYQRWVGTYQDIPEEVIRRLAENDGRNSVIAEEYARNRDEYGKTIIFADRWEQCEAIREKLTKRGVRAGTMYSHVARRGGTADERNEETCDDNSAVLRDFKEGKLDVVINIRMLTEGTDVPDAQTVFLTRQTTSQILLTQMIGRALRGPKFGGTEEATIVSFIDDWKHRIQWAQFELDQLEVDPDSKAARRQLPLQLVSIELVRRLARQMDRGENVNPLPFLTYLPGGWYEVKYLAQQEGAEDWSDTFEAVMIFEHHRDAWRALIDAALSRDVRGFEDAAVTLDSVRHHVEALDREFFSGLEEVAGDRLRDVFGVLRHVAQNGAAPRFVPFEERSLHNLDAVAQAHIERDVGPRAIDADLRNEYVNPNRFWRAMYHRYEQFRFEYDACAARILLAMRLGEEPQKFAVRRWESSSPPPLEPTEEMKKEVRQRDHDTCLCCGASGRGVRLQVDHVRSRYNGGGHTLENLQTLCSVCNGLKSIKEISFRNHATSLSQPSATLPIIPTPKAGSDEVAWSRYLRRIVNTFYQCAAVEAITAPKRGADRGTVRIDLFTGNDERWIEPHLPALLGALDSAATGGATPAAIEVARDFGGNVARADAHRPRRSSHWEGMKGLQCPTCGALCEVPWCYRCEKPV